MLFRGQPTSVHPLDQRHLYLRLVTQRGGETDLRGVVSPYSAGGGACCLRPIRDPATFQKSSTGPSPCPWFVALVSAGLLFVIHLAFLLRAPEAAR